MPIICWPAQPMPLNTSLLPSNLLPALMANCGHNDEEEGMEETVHMMTSKSDNSSLFSLCSVCQPHHALRECTRVDSVQIIIDGS